MTDAQTQMRIVAHVDMDCFYAACEEKRDPSLKGKPIVVGADPKSGAGRGVVSTASYAARKFGIKSGMPISLAFRACPECVFLRPDYALYVETSTRIMGILRKISKIEQWGIDEAFLELTGIAKDYEDAEVIAKEIKREILSEVELTCSVGIGPNKLVAKIASDFHKPDGLTIVRKEEAKGFLAPLAARKLIFVGEKTEKALAVLGISTIGQLADADPGFLFEKLGNAGPLLARMANGIDDSPVEQRTESKSISVQFTFEKDTDSMQAIGEMLDAICEEIVERAKAEDVSFGKVGATVRFTGFETHSREKSLGSNTIEISVLKKVAIGLISSLMSDKSNGRAVRLIGVKVSNLSKSEGQKTLGAF